MRFVGDEVGPARVDTQQGSGGACKQEHAPPREISPVQSQQTHWKEERVPLMGKERLQELGQGWVLGGGSGGVMYEGETASWIPLIAGLEFALIGAHVMWIHLHIMLLTTNR